ncbi:right-handed parallel beta-helix repeat-containing protein [Candidatus Bathyarchaeota archaeon]|nr:right-handed parallel beta-helix repeat-containing protein [Candidatus Bathyarchaeota archaeon]
MSKLPVIAALIVIVTLGLMSTDKAFAQRSVGVKTGDWTSYDYVFSGNATMPPRNVTPLWAKVSVYGVNGTSIQIDEYYQEADGGNQGSAGAFDVEKGDSRAATNPWFIAANLTQGDAVYTSPPVGTLLYGATINNTFTISVWNSSKRQYDVLESNHWNATNSWTDSNGTTTVSHEFFWLKESGILFNSTEYTLVQPFVGNTTWIEKTIRPAEEVPTIYIRANGSVDPPTAPISHNGNVYTLTANISSDADGIVIERDNTILDGAGYTVTGIIRGNGTTLANKSNVTVRNMTIKKFSIGIGLSSSSNDTLSGNNVTPNNSFGIVLDSSSSNVLSGNNVTNNYYGIGLYNSSNNVFYHNNFVNGNGQVSSYYGSVNVWDNGVEGNYWSDYKGTDLHSGSHQNETGSDGIGDTPYIIDGNNTDHYPLMGRLSESDWISLVAPEHRIQTICNSTISNLVYNGTAISFNVTGDKGTSGFCRINIPKVFMNSTFQVFVNGTEIAFTILPCSNENITYLYFNYTHSTEQVIIIPEFSSILILPLFMLTTLTAVIAWKKKRLKSP